MDRRLLIAGRVLLSAIFILSGVSKITGWRATEASLVSKGLPLVPVVLALVILVEIVGGLMVLTGFHAKWAAIVLFLFLIPTTLMFHAFWSGWGSASGPDGSLCEERCDYGRAAGYRVCVAAAMSGLAATREWRWEGSL